MKKSNTLRLLLTWVFLSSSVFLFAQPEFIPLQHFFTREIGRSVAAIDSMKHTGWKPFLKNDFNLSKVTGFSKDSAKYYDLIGTLLLRDHLIEVKDKDFHLAIDPLFDFTVGKDMEDVTNYQDSITIYYNTRGALIQGAIGTQLSFHSGFYETQAFFPQYLRDVTQAIGTVPGMGRPKKFKDGGFDYNMSFGAVNYTPIPNLHFQIGYGKHFVGHGYRSLLLSDASFAYPYIEGTWLFAKNKLRYTTFYSTLQSLERLPIGETPEPLFQRKGGSFHYLSWIPAARIEIGFFEGVIWQRQNQSGTHPLPWDAWIPLIGLNTAMNGFDSKNNVVAGTDVCIKATDRASVYSQLLLDDPSSKKIGWQVGARYFDLLLRNLDLQMEWNKTADGVYSSRYAIQSYSHFGQPLGAPYGAGADEWVASLHYRYKRFILKIKFNAIRQAVGTNGNEPSDPSPEMVDVALFNRKMDQWDIQSGLYLNPKTNLQLLLGYIDRMDAAIAEIPGRHTGFLYVGVRTNLHNRYWDF